MLTKGSWIRQIADKRTFLNLPTNVNIMSCYVNSCQWQNCWTIGLSKKYIWIFFSFCFPLTEAEGGRKRCRKVFMHWDWLSWADTAPLPATQHNLLPFQNNIFNNLYLATRPVQIYNYIILDHTIYCNITLLCSYAIFVIFCRGQFILVPFFST